ncbi:TetR-like C-terminal domain-containing protein [Saccharopolyspora erythraea]|nr:TetR-like C-terminal domain-containing protein [Saccharopolyspora erythraea]
MSEASRRKSPPVRFREVAQRFRSWALVRPHRYPQLFGTPGYRAPS